MLKCYSALALCMLWIVAAPVGLSAADNAGNGEYTIRSTVSEIRVLLTAADAQGRRVAQLQPKDVAVVDNDEVIRRFRSFSPVSETPLHLVVLVDVSDSVRKQIAGELEMVNEFVHFGKWRSEDQVSVLAFGGSGAKILCHQDCRERQVSVEGQSVASATPLYDSLIAASELLTPSHSENSRAAIVLLSDGVDNFSKRSLRDAISAAQEVEASVYTLNSNAKRVDVRGNAALDQIAEETGGIAYAQGQDTAQALNAVLDDLRQGFVLTYELPHSGTARHTVRVVPALNSRLRFRCRRTYTETSAAK